MFYANPTVTYPDWSRWFVLGLRGLLDSDMLVSATQTSHIGGRTRCEFPKCKWVCVLVENRLYEVELIIQNRFFPENPFFGLLQSLLKLTLGTISSILLPNLIIYLSIKIPYIQICIP